ncbi:MAG: HAD-IA family hydrolase [Xanthomonadales bacterium]|nr:HAD-IA family hydrolase [Xanthomonadales bacterium]
MSGTADGASNGRALLVDYGGVLTPGVVEGWRAFEAAHDMPERTISRMLWAAYEPDAGEENPIVRLERGDLEIAEFERQLAAQLAEAGHDVEAEGLVRRLFSALRPEPGVGVWELVADVRDAGVPTVLVSNTWGTDAYPLDELEALFDALVFSGRVGMRKPDREIFEHAVGLVEAELAGSVLIDDAPANVEAARSYGLTGVLHTGDVAATRRAVTDALDL